MVSQVRDGKLVWPYCTECGCRLNLAIMEEYVWLMHFGQAGPKDARGCSCSFVSETQWVETEYIYQGVV